MDLLYCDESNLEERSGDFLIYGGLIFDGERARALSLAIDNIRLRLGVPADYKLKFNPGPEGFTHAQFIELKQSVLECAVDHGAKMLTYVVLHDLAKNPDEARRFGINTLCYHFDCILNRKEGTGLVLIDRFNDGGNQIDAHLAEKFATGVRFHPNGSSRALSRIVGFHYSAVGQSHFPSIVDVAIGSLRYGINSFTRRDEKALAGGTKLLGLLSPLFWRQEASAPIPELGFMFSPASVRNSAYFERYAALRAHLCSAGVEVAHEVRGAVETWFETIIVR